MPLKGIDISSWQAGIDPAATDSDFVIVKATGGTGYINPYYRRQADAALAAGKLLGVYHFAHEEGWCPGDAASEAAHFLNAIAPYRGRAIPVLDWEDRAQSLPVSWAKEWLDIVARETGARPWFYAYASYLNSRDHSLLHGYPLWMASYLDRYDGCGYVTNPAQTWPIAGWNYLTCYQYTSTGRVKGWSGNLDLNIFYGDAEDWAAMCGGKGAGVTVDLADVAARIHRDMCDDERNGYSWKPRNGGDHPDGTKVVEVNGRRYSYPLGSYDCSSSVCKAWQLALEGTPYEGALDGATFTGNMRSVFKASGLFEVWDTASTTAQRGDVYLNDGMHTAMCQSPDPDTLSEFSMSETGDVYNNQVGDQTRWESHVCGYYDYPWDCTLHYNHKADYREKTTPREDEDLKRVTNSGGTVARLYHPKGWHLLTMDAGEVKACKKGGWTDEGKAFVAPRGGTEAVYRLYNPGNGDHLYTTDFKEAQACQKAGWSYEGVPFFGNAKGAEVHRLYNPKSGLHHFTADANERDTLVKKYGWKSEGVGWRV